MSTEPSESTARSRGRQHKQSARNELNPSSSASLVDQYDVLTEEEQQRVLQRLVIQNETDIRMFSTFLKMPTVLILMLNLLFVYNYVTSGFGTADNFAGAKMPISGVRIYAEHPIVATELSVVMLQFALYLLSYERWDRWTKIALGALLVLGTLHALVCRKSGFFEFGWWMLPVIDLVAVSYAQLNMRRSRQAIKDVARSTYHVKSA
ncbi:hypothetical protein LPJ64_001039 [Coemansia asiatica]|uniref:Uncharacterized protein n=1 Tax=Coemansia asiatica TaxID=1052880 RepID=A0A9W7XQT0_9FUNG|nr:hypothetical protein LPJ64_001039 [Coemansia asiatica]KAJ2877601.1 hypothetical protein FB639_003688 [Coemansia asiatica]